MATTSSKCEEPSHSIKEKIVAEDTDQTTAVDEEVDAARKKLTSWIGEIFEVAITDRRVIVGRFVCTDNDSNLILENSWEYTNLPIGGCLKPRALGLALIPGKHIVRLLVMNNKLIDT